MSYDGGERMRCPEEKLVKRNSKQPQHHDRLPRAAESAAIRSDRSR